jgi:hypothetical protein
MPLYTFHLCKPDGIAVTFQAITLRSDGETFAKAGELLDDHLSCDHVEVWDGDRAVVARYRFQPVIRPIDEAA